MRSKQCQKAKKTNAFKEFPNLIHTIPLKRGNQQTAAKPTLNLGIFLA
jgi:hypothetical protein